MDFNEDTGEPEEVGQPDARIAHILQGYEAKMLEVVLSLHGTAILLLEHDGWVTRDRIDEHALIAAIREHPALRFDMKLKSEKLDAPRVNPQNP